MRNCSGVHCLLLGSVQLPNAYFQILGKQLIDTIASCVGHTDYMAVVTAMPDVLRVMPSVHGLMLFPAS
jgi:hypothetical protein